MKKIIVLLVILTPAIVGAIYWIMNSQPLPYISVCKKGNSRYTHLCNNIGKRAYNTYGLGRINQKDYGPILGVAWRKKGSIISPPGHQKRYSERNSYYYIIGSDNSDYSFLRLVNEIDPRDK